MEPDGTGRVRLEYRIPARGLIGFQNEFLNLTRGTGLISQHLRRLRAATRARSAGRKNGVLISHGRRRGRRPTRWASCDDRGRMFVAPSDPVYEGMIVGIHSPRQRPRRQRRCAGQAADQLPRLRQGRRDQDHAADPAHAGIRGRVHRRRRAGRDHAEVDPPAQALPEGARAQEGFARSSVTGAAGRGSGQGPRNTGCMQPGSAGFFC